VGCPSTAKEVRYEVAVDIAGFDNVVPFDNMPDYAGMRSRPSAPGAAQPLSPIVVTGTKPGVERGRDEHATRVIRRPPVERV
jgi:hypothetical protein